MGGGGEISTKKRGIIVAIIRYLLLVLVNFFYLFLFFYYFNLISIHLFPHPLIQNFIHVTVDVQFDDFSIFKLSENFSV